MRPQCELLGCLKEEAFAADPLAWAIYRRLDTPGVARYTSRQYRSLYQRHLVRRSRPRAEQRLVQKQNRSSARGGQRKERQQQRQQKRQQAKATVKARETASFSYVIAMGAALIFATACALTVLHFVRNLEDVCMD